MSETADALRVSQYLLDRRCCTQQHWTVHAFNSTWPHYCWISFETLQWNRQWQATHSL